MRAELPIDPLARPRRFVLLPRPWVFIVIGGGVGLPGAFLALAGLLALLRGYLFGLALLVIAGFVFVLVWMAVGGQLWADAEQVRCTRLGERGSCSRKELAELRITPTRGRSGPNCIFVRRDESVAFRTVARVWGRTQLTALASYLGVPLTESKQRT